VYSSGTLMFVWKGAPKGACALFWHRCVRLCCSFEQLLCSVTELSQLAQVPSNYQQYAHLMLQFVLGWFVEAVL
jgi:hypothetical protein